MATKQIPIEDIVDNPFQPRATFDRAALQSLADEIKAEGFWSGSLQGRKTKNGKVELVFGHRRLRALKLLKTETVPIEIVDLTDAEMALRGLEENLQREGLEDIEKADAVKQAVEIQRKTLRAEGKPDDQAVALIAKRLGLGEAWVRQLCLIADTIVSSNRDLVEAKYLSAKTAWLAKKWGGDAYVKTLAKQGKQAKDDPTVAKPSENTIEGMKKAVRLAPESIQEKLKTAIITGDVTTPTEAEQKGRRMAAERTKRNKLPPKDLEAAIVGWTHRFDDWAAEVKDILPYLEFIDEAAPAITGPFWAAVDRFSVIAKQVVASQPKAAPRQVGHSTTIKPRKRLTS